MFGRKRKFFGGSNTDNQPVSEQDVLSVLSEVKEPDTGQSLTNAKMVSGIDIQNSNVAFMIEVDPSRGAALEALRQQAEKAVLDLDGVEKVTAILTAAKKAASPAQQIPVQKGPNKAISSAAKMDPHGMAKNPPLELPFKKIIAVASGKGGVGKSTIAVNLALALSNTGLKTAILDADIYGPSLPRMLGLPPEKPKLNDIEKLTPHEKFGLKVMSMGFMVEEETPMIWRGPMVQTAIYQMLRDVDWANEVSGTPEEMDILVVDMPPGTGDAQLTMAQKVPLSGAVIVSTPQDIALLDARKGLAMFEKVEVPVLGIVENMSTFICPNCEHETHIFGHNGAKDEAEKLGCNFLGAIPLQLDIRVQSDDGKPIILADPGNDASKVFQDIATSLKARLFAN